MPNAMQPLTAPTTVHTDFLPLEGTDYIEFYVGNAKQAAHYYRSVMGFQPLAYSGPETGDREKVSYVLRQNKVQFMFTTPLRSQHPIADHIHRHGDGIRVLALRVPDANQAWLETTRRGGRSFMEPRTMKDAQGQVVVSGIHTYGEVVHLFIERKDYHGAFLPSFRPWQTPHFKTLETGLLYIDHCVGNVGWNQMNPWVKFYEEVMGFRNILSFDDKDISTEYSALMSKVMSNGNGYVKFPINEPAEGKKKSQVEEYLDYYGGEGVQHVALATKDIVQTVTQLRDRGMEFLKVPDSYYDELESRVGKIDEDIAPLRELGILVDRDEEGYLLQLFSKPVEDRPTLFFEIIQRKGAKSFGKGNFKALFEAIEREQGLRGNL
jgi:4-hydroxyphenylpyruvate dioxygenase